MSKVLLNCDEKWLETNGTDARKPLLNVPAEKKRLIHTALWQIISAFPVSTQPHHAYVNV